MGDLVDELAAARIGTTYNFYAGGGRAPLLRARLRTYLRARSGAGVLLVGEAAGYRGARVSGLPFTSERQLTGAGPAEATATLVRRALADLGREQDVLLWNLVPTHPHRPEAPDSNRPPTRSEIDAARPFLERLAHGRRVGAYVRHPSHGGARAFRHGLAEALA